MSTLCCCGPNWFAEVGPRPIEIDLLHGLVSANESVPSPVVPSSIYQAQKGVI